MQHIDHALRDEARKRIWFHCASLGEFEQARPVIESLKQRYPGHCIVLTFFSPSGYEAQKDNKGADHVFYLPTDTRRNASLFLDRVQPCCALFVKYEFWFHYLDILAQRHIPVILFSALFRPRQPFFKWYGSLYRQMLGCYRQIFVQDNLSAQLLAGIGVRQVQVAGDTRFDRTWSIAQSPVDFPDVDIFKGHAPLIIAGSTWSRDEALLKEVIDQLPQQYKLLVAPHNIDPARIEEILKLFKGICCDWRDNEEQLRQSRVAVVSEIGHLSFLYRYADMVWVGGGFTRTGIHNIIEPAVYGKPVLFGPHYDRYKEAVDMLEEGAAATFKDAEEIAGMIKNNNALQLMGNKARHYVLRRLGATGLIISYLEEKCLDNK